MNAIAALNASKNLESASVEMSPSIVIVQLINISDTGTLQMPVGVIVGSVDGFGVGSGVG